MITKSLFSWEEIEDWMHRGNAWKELTASLQLAFNLTPACGICSPLGSMELQFWKGLTSLVSL